MDKVIEFTTALSDGGAETLIANYAMDLMRDGFIPEILTIYPVTNSANHKRISEGNISCISIFKSHSLLSRIIRILFGFIIIPIRLKKIIKKEKPDCIHAHQRVLRYLKQAVDSLDGIRLVYTCHSIPELIFNQIPAEKKAAQYLIQHKKMTVIALHKEMADQIHELFNINPIILRNGVNFDQFRKVLQTKEEIRKSLSIPDDAFVLGHVGRFSKLKNHLFLIDVFFEVLKIKPNAFLLLVGSGPEEHNVKEKIKHLGIDSKVLILSHRTDVPLLMKAMDAFVFPSQYEGLSVTLIEAQVSGLRCVISNTINTETILLPSTIRMPLNASPEEWSCSVINTNLVNEDYGNISEFDSRETMRKLESIYQTE